MKSSEQIFKELNLRPRICEEKTEKTEINPSDEITQAISANIQSNSRISAPNTGFSAGNLIGWSLMLASALSIISTIFFKK